MSKNLLTGIPVIGGMFDNSDEDAMNAIRANQELWGQLKTPDLQWQDYNPENYHSEDAQANTVSEDPMLRSAQMSALQKMAGLANTGLSAVDEAGYQQAQSQGNQLAQGATQAAIANAQARGVGGSGLEFAMREMGNQSGADRAQQAGLQVAADSARQRALYNQAYGNQLSQQRAQDFSNNSHNADILNQFNMMNTQNRNQANMYNVGNRNQAQQTNNQGHINTQQQNYNNQVTKLGGETGANQQMANAYAAQNAANTADRNSNTQLVGQIGMGLMGSPSTPKKSNIVGGDNGGSFGNIA